MRSRRASGAWRSALVWAVLAACDSFLPVPPRMAPSHSEREPPTFPTYSTLRARGGLWRNLADTLRYGETMELVPVSTYHLRFAYTPQKIASYTEWPLGLGFGRALIDSRGNRREVFAIVHEDSAARIQYNLGYLYLWNRPLLASSPSVTLGAGYVLLLMGRWDWSYAPVPLILPIASLTVSRVSVETTFVPGWIGYGNVLFTWLQFRL
jgi:lipid IVA palmitoyltransferase